MDVYNMLQEIPKDENGFFNTICGCSYEEYKQWLINSAKTANGIELEDWMVPQSIFWLYAGGIPVGFGKLRHHLNERLKEKGGHAGYAIVPSQRNRGYGRLLLKLLVEEAKMLGIDKLLLTIQNDNPASLKVAFANGGVIDRVTDERHYVLISLMLS